MTRDTPLHAVHTALGATFTDFAGWRMPLRYTSDLDEHHAVRRRAGLFDLSHMGQIEVTGEQATAALDRSLVSDIGKIAVGRAKYTMLCADDGGIVDDLVVYRLAEHRFLVVANAANYATVLQQLQDRAGAATVTGACDDWSLIAVQGPAAAAIVAAATGLDPEPLKYYAVQPAGRDVLLARTGYTGEDGFEIYCRPDQASTIWTALSAAGRQHGMASAGLACRDSLRLEAGMPLYCHELSRQYTPFEAGLGRIVALDKSVPYAGQQALRDRHAQGPSTVLVGLTAAGRRSPRSGHPVLDPGGRPIGQVTSGIPSPTLGHPIAMAYIAIEHAATGTPLLVDIRGSREPHVVTELPFYRRPRAQEATSA